MATAEIDKFILIYMAISVCRYPVKIITPCQKPVELYSEHETLSIYAVYMYIRRMTIWTDRKNCYNIIPSTQWRGWTKIKREKKAQQKTFNIHVVKKINSGISTDSAIMWKFTYLKAVYSKNEIFRRTVSGILVQ